MTLNISSSTESKGKLHTFCIISTSVHTLYLTAYEQILLFQGFDPQTIRVSLENMCLMKEQRRTETPVER